MSLLNPMRQALEALDTALFWLKDADLGTTYVAMQKRAEALRQVIGQAEKMEPFGIWHQGATEEESDFFLFKDAGDVSCPDCIKLYTNPPTATLTSEMLIEAALSASAAGLLSGTTNWAKHVQQKLLVKQPTTPAVGNTTCNPHPDAPHGFARNASHAEGRYVCECEGWMPPVQPLTPTKPLNDFDMREVLASKLLCWPRLTEAETKNLIYFFEEVCKYDQQAMELCEVCGWKAKMDGEPCLVCQSQQIDKLQAAAQLGLDAFDKMIGRKPEFVEQAVAALRQALK